MVKALLHVPGETEKLIFYSEDFLGEILLQAKGKPLIKVKMAQNGKGSDGKLKIVHIEPEIASTRSNKLFCLLEETRNGKKSLRIDSV